MNKNQDSIDDYHLLVAKYGKALCHPVRVFILDYLSKNFDKCCYSGDMAELLPIARSTLSEHLSELKRAGLIQGEISAPYIKYCINRDEWKKAKDVLSDFFDVMDKIGDFECSL